MTNKKKISLKEIADRIPCSPATVSIVLNGRADKYRIAAETQHKIKETAEKMGYVAKTAKPVSPAAKPGSGFITVAIILGLTDSLPMSDMLRGISEMPRYGNKLIEYCIHPFAPGHLKDYEAVLLSQKYDGLIILPIVKTDCDYLRTLTITVPCVVMSNNIPGFNCVITDKIECGALVAKLCHAKGHNNVGLITRNTFSESGLTRALGFTSTYEQLGRHDAKITIIKDKTDKDFGLSSMNELLEKTASDPPTAIFVTEPNNLSGTLTSLRNFGKVPPDDFELVMFGDYSDDVLSMCMLPSITTVGIPVKEMITDSINLVCHQVEGGLLNGITKIHHPEISFRASCTKPENWDSVVKELPVF